MIGQTLGHYRVLEKIGAGGMGVVYRAHDERLDRDVALKVLPAGTLADEATRKRFRQEALALSKLAHPHIAVVHDFDTQNQVDFLVMEYLAGATLATKLAEGTLPEQEVARLGVQIASALEEAHEQGVVHRDLKPGNIMVTLKGQTKVLDFGLAKFWQPSSTPPATESLTATQAVAGTLPYMAPEQLRGEKVDPRTDVYALGAVLYEMATGQTLFPGTGGPMLIDAILHSSPVPPGKVHAEVSPELESVILKALDKDPGRRYQSARDFRLALEPIAAGVPGAAPRRAARRWALAAAAALGVLLLALMAFDVGGWREQLLARFRSGQEVEPRRSVAVLGFKNLSGRPDAAWLSTALSEMLTTELAAGEKLRTVPGEAVARTKLELSLADADSYAKDTLNRIRASLGSDVVVFGSYTALGKEAGGQIRLDLRLQDAVSGETIASLAEAGSEAQLFDLVTRAGLRLRQEMGAGEMAPEEQAGVRAAFPSSPEAARLYAEGLAKLRFFDSLAARHLLERAVAAEPTHPLTRSALAAAWSALGYDGKAREEAQQALALSAHLSREERLLVEARARETMKEWEKAVETYRTLWTFFPDNLDYGLHLAAAQTAAGKAADALATVEALRKLPAPAAEDPRIDLEEAAAAEALSDFRRQQAAAAQAETKGKALGARLLVARARHSQGAALDSLGEPKSAREAFEEARRIHAAAGDRAGVARALNSIASLLKDQGDLAGARAMFGESLAISREIGDQKGVAAALNNIGNVFSDLGNREQARRSYRESQAVSREIGDKKGVAKTLNNLALLNYYEGNLAGARALFEQSQALYREMGDQGGTALALTNIGNVLLAQGDLNGAKQKYEEALPIYRAIGEKQRLAMVLNNLAAVFGYQGKLDQAQKMFEEMLSLAREMGNKSYAAASLDNIGQIRATTGDLAGARQRYEESLALYREIGEKSGVASALAHLGTVLAAQGDLAGARAKHEEALAIRNEIGEKVAAAESRAALAWLALDENRPKDAEKLARQAAEEFARAQATDAEATARAALTQSLAAQEKHAEAREAIRRAQALTAKSEDRAVRFQVAITAARLAARSGNRAEARKNLEATLKEATEAGFVGAQLEARLALGEIEMTAGRPVLARASLETLEKEATAKGYALIARKAAAARSASLPSSQ